MFIDMSCSLIRLLPGQLRLQFSKERSEETRGPFVTAGFPIRVTHEFIYAGNNSHLSIFHIFPRTVY